MLVTGKISISNKGDSGQSLGNINFNRPEKWLLKAESNSRMKSVALA